MNREKLVRKALQRSRLPLTLEEGGDFLNVVLDVVGEALTSGEKVIFAGFGTFKPVRRRGGMGRHPQTGELMTRSDTATVQFKPHCALLQQLPHPENLPAAPEHHSAKPPLPTQAEVAMAADGHGPRDPRSTQADVAISDECGGAVRRED
ncbi:MAG: HU family DNA-binding protein [Candidatus Peregrinibacteria bacterium]